MTESDPLVWVFFYGSYMNFDVLAEVRMKPARWAHSREVLGETYWPHPVVVERRD